MSEHAPEIQRGLEGVVVAESALSRIDGEAGRLVYRGHAVEELVTEASYEETLHLLWHGELPDREALAEFSASLRTARSLDEDVHSLVADLAAADEDPMAALRTVVSALSAADPAVDGTTADPDDEATHLRSGRRIAAKLPTALAAFQRRRDGEEPVAPDPELGHAANFLSMLTGAEPDPVTADVFDSALVLHADHGINASTFAARVTASTLADVYSAVTSAVGTLGGSLHGGANADVMEMLLDIDDADVGPVEWVRRALDEGRRVPGFGHRVYDVKDPRAKLLGQRAAELGEATGEPHWFEYGSAIESYLAAEKRIAPNVDFYSAPTYYQLGIPIDLYTPIFATSRVGGWIAHVREQYADNRLIRPRSHYVGPADRETPPIDRR